MSDKHSKKSFKYRARGIPKSIVSHDLTFRYYNITNIEVCFFVMGWDNAHHYISLIKCIIQSIKGLLRLGGFNFQSSLFVKLFSFSVFQYDLTEIHSI